MDVVLPLLVLLAAFVAVFLVGKKYGQIVEQELVAGVLAEYHTVDGAIGAITRTLLGSLSTGYSREYDRAVAALESVKKAL